MKIIPAESRGPKPRGLTAQQRAQLAAMERRLSRYLHLDCGHYTTIQSQIFFSGPPHDPNTYYCETCRLWIPEKKKPVYVILDEPPY